jgi:hypothetical protein
VPIDLSVHQLKRSHHIVPSSALGVFRRVHRFASTSLCTKQEASALGVFQRVHCFASTLLCTKPLLEVRRCNLHANLGEPRSLTEQQLSYSPESRSTTPMMSLTDGKEEPFIMNPTWIAFSCTFIPNLHTMQRSAEKLQCSLGLKKVVNKRNLYHL